MMGSWFMRKIVKFGGNESHDNIPRSWTVYCLEIYIFLSIWPGDIRSNLSHKQYIFYYIFSFKFCAQYICVC
jgi:hypothetical protein